MATSTTEPAVERPADSQRPNRFWNFFCRMLAWPTAMFAGYAFVASAFLAALWIRAKTGSIFLIDASALVSMLAAGFLVITLDRSHIADIRKQIGRLGFAALFIGAILPLILGFHFLANEWTKSGFQPFSEGTVLSWARDILVIWLLFACLLIFPAEIADGMCKSIRSSPRPATWLAITFGLLIGCAAIPAASIFNFARSYSYLKEAAAIESQDIHFRNKMFDAYKKHYDNILRGVLVPNRAISDFGKDLESIELGGVPDGFRVAFKQYARAWAELGAEVEKNTGLVGIVRAEITGGTSILEAWLVTYPEKVRVIEEAEKKLVKAADIELIQRLQWVFHDSQWYKDLSKDVQHARWPSGAAPRLLGKI